MVDPSDSSEEREMGSGGNILVKVGNEKISKRENIQTLPNPINTQCYQLN